MSAKYSISRRGFIKASSLTGGALLLPAQGISGHPADKGSSVPVPLPGKDPATFRQLDLSPARWIWFPMERCLPSTVILFRREVELKEDPVSARGYILADSRYKLYLNGERLQFGPAPSDPRWMEADPVDLTGKLVRGKNVIGSEVLFYGIGDGTWPIGKPGFLFKLEIAYGDGHTDLLISDEKWQTCIARSWQPGRPKRWFLRAFQEEFDARKYPYGWNDPSFVPGRNWLAALCYSDKGDKPPICFSLPEYMWEISHNPDTCSIRERSVPMLTEPVIHDAKLTDAARITWHIPAEDYFDSKVPGAYTGEWAQVATDAGNGRWIVEPDTGHSASLVFGMSEQRVGWPLFTIEAPEGTVVEIMVQESHKPGSVFMLDSHFYSWTRFICREGINRFETFDFESYRWIQFIIRNNRSRVTLSDIGIRRRLYPWPASPEIKCSDKALEKLFAASLNTLNNSAQDTMVDGMGRERQQYSGDCGHQLHPVFTALGESRLPGRYIMTFGQGATLGGYFMDSWPAFDRLARTMERQLHLTGWGPILDHSVGFCFDSYYYYLYTGKTDALTETFPRLLGFFSYLDTIKDSRGLLKVQDIGLPSVWIDHEAYKKQSHKQCAFNLYTAAMCIHALAPLCKVFGEEKWAREVTSFGRDIQERCVGTFWDASRRTFICNLPWVAEEGEYRMCDRSLATAVLYDFCPGNDTDPSVEILAQCPPQLGISYPANAIWRYWALARKNKIDVVLDDFRKRWCTMDSVNENNTLQENWKARYDSPDEWSHCPQSALIILYHGILGLHPLTPGFGSCTVCPQPGDIKEISFLAHTASGTIGFKCSGPRGKRKMTFAIPQGMHCELLLNEKEEPGLAAGAATVPPGYRSFLLPAGKTTEVTAKYI